MSFRPSDEASLEFDLIAEAQIKFTESKEKVAQAISNLFRKDGELRIEKDRVQFVSTRIGSLQFLKDQFRDRRVRAAARRLLVSNRESDSDSTFFLLNKQAATVSIGALCDDPRESAMGPIVVRIRSNRLDFVIDWLTEGYERVERS